VILARLRYDQKNYDEALTITGHCGYVLRTIGP
jgi:hypothetical protein